MWRTILRGGRAMATSVIALLLVTALQTSIPHSVVAQSIDSNRDASAHISTPPRATTAFTIGLQSVVGGLSSPVDVRNAGDGSGRLFVVEQDGYLRVIRNGVLKSTPFLTLTNKTSADSERGLLSLAFDPDYASNGTFYVYYTADPGGAITIERYVVSNPASDTPTVTASNVVLSVPHPNSNHNGGQLHFGSDNYLYTGLGDGGGGGDPDDNGQAPAALLGKMLRLNVRGAVTYTIPATNPFTQTAGYRPEIWALGLRNPYRFAFDRLTGDIFIGDVGQNCWEEIDYQPASSAGGENYGWNVMEGLRPFNVNNFNDCNQAPITPPGLTLPVAVYGHGQGSAVTGGYVYRGQQYPVLNGVYFYSDSGSGRIWALEHPAPNVWVNTEKLDSPYSITSFGEDENGEVYVADYFSGGIYQIVSALAAAPSIDLSTSTKTVSPGTAQRDNVVTYTIALRNSGDPFNNTVRVTDTIPIGLSYVNGSFAATGGTVDASAAPTLKWQGSMGSVSAITLTFAARVTALTAQTITNTAQINPVISPTLTRSAPLTVLNAPPDFSPSTKHASSASVASGAAVTYTIVLRNVGGPATSTVRITDTIPTGLNYVPGSFTASLGSVDPSSAPILKWQGVPSTTPAVTLTYVVTVSAVSPTAIPNSVTIDPGVGASFTRSATIIANGLQLYLPLITKMF